MKGLLFYDEIGAERNKWFIARLIESAEALGCELSLVVTSSVTEAVIECESHPDFAIIRTISPSISEEVERLTKIFNNSTTSKIANDKWQTYLLARELDIPMMHTVSLKDGLDKSESPTYPRVIKTVDGHGGSEVFMVHNTDECKAILSLYPDKHFISQELSSEPGVDMRVYVMGDSVVAATKRTSKADFRSNFSLGGNAELDTPTAEMLCVIERLRNALHFDFVGIDFIRHNGGWVLNEIEDVVGTRMLYSLTDIDAAKTYIEYIVNKLTEAQN